jgi:hypothetical protein
LPQRITPHGYDFWDAQSEDLTPPTRRLKDQGKPDKVVRTAAARKLLLLAHAIYESGESVRAPAEEVT